MSEIDFTKLSPGELAKAAMLFTAEAELAQNHAMAAKRELDRRKGVGAFVFPEFGLTVEIKVQHKFVASEAKKNLSAAKLKLISVPTPTATAAKTAIELGKFTEADFKKCQKTYDNSVTIKFADRG